MFVDEGGWGRPSEPARTPSLTPRQERVILNLILVVALLTLLAPIGGGTVVQAAMALYAELH